MELKQPSIWRTLIKLFSPILPSYSLFPRQGLLPLWYWLATIVDTASALHLLTGLADCCCSLVNLFVDCCCSLVNLTAWKVCAHALQVKGRSGVSVFCKPKGTGFSKEGSEHPMLRQQHIQSNLLICNDMLASRCHQRISLSCLRRLSCTRGYHVVDWPSVYK